MIAIATPSQPKFMNGFFENLAMARIPRHQGLLCCLLGAVGAVSAATLHEIRFSLTFNTSASNGATLQQDCAWRRCPTGCRSEFVAAGPASTRHVTLRAGTNRGFCQAVSTTSTLVSESGVAGTFTGTCVGARSAAGRCCVRRCAPSSLLTTTSSGGRGLRGRVC